MTERDLQRVLTQSVQDVHLSDEARRNIRLATKEERPVKMKKFVAIALAVVLMLSASIAVAEELGLFDFLAREMGQTVLPDANELVQSDVAYGETDAVTYTVKQAVYDGKSVSLMLEVRAKDANTMLMCSAWSPDEQIGWYELFMEGIDHNDERTFVQYAAENGYTRFASASLRIVAGDESQIESWNNNVLTVLYSLNAEGDELVLPFEFRSRTYTYDTTYHMDELQHISHEITLTACDPLWTVSSDETFDMPNFGIRIDGVTITGTVLQSYWTLDFTVTDLDKAQGAWNPNLLDMEGNYLPTGALGGGGCPLPVKVGQQLTWSNTFGAMEQPPTELMILLRNWDNFDLNEYFPITLK